MHQARFFGRSETCFQVLMAATIATFSLIARTMREMGTEQGRIETQPIFFSPLNVLVRRILCYLKGSEALVFIFY
ncbi:MAG: hypothetical protein A2Z14_05720 [Chloroflexi bacterium RBG_16_48_8]|nr:MAG: hypothetical protein A2Z14_05720 [Chloroflexi bacterium RBG_16_48_8]